MMTKINTSSVVPNFFLKTNSRIYSRKKGRMVFSVKYKNRVMFSTQAIQTKPWYLNVGFMAPSSSSNINLLMDCFDLFFHSITTTSIKVLFAKDVSLLDALIACN